MCYTLFMNKQTKILLTIIAVIIAVWAIVRSFPTQIHAPAPVVSSTEEEKDWNLLGAPTFTWTYSPVEKGSVSIPYNIVSLTATYPEGTIDTKEIDTIEGDCNEYVNPDKDVYLKSTEIICYYAGLGRYYKVVKDGTEYLVKKKEFEEGTPDYNPPTQEFVTIVKF